MSSGNRPPLNKFAQSLDIANARLDQIETVRPRAASKHSRFRSAALLHVSREEYDGTYDDAPDDRRPWQVEE